MLFHRIKACIFDLDGVIVDTAKYHFKSWQSLALSFNYDFRPGDNETLKGVSRMKSLEIILDLAGVKKNLEEREYLCAKKNEKYLRHIEGMTEEEILPGVIELIQSLRRANIKIALGSASKNATHILTILNIFQYFDVIVDGNHVTKGKPDPEVFFKGALALQVEPHACVVFEDAAKGIDAAKAAGMVAIGVGDEINLSQADFVIPNFEHFTIYDLTEVSRLFASAR